MMAIRLEEKNNRNFSLSKNKLNNKLVIIFLFFNKKGMIEPGRRRYTAFKAPRPAFAVLVDSSPENQYIAL